MIETFDPAGGQPKDIKAMKEMMETGNPCIGSNFIYNFKSQLITKRLLLMRLAQALGYTNQLAEERPAYTVDASSFNHQRIARLRDGTASWSRTFNAIREHLRNSQGPGESFGPSAPTQTFSSSERLNYRALTMLVGARRNLRNSDFFSAACNLQLTAFMVMWHCNVSKLARLRVPANEVSNTIIQRNTPFPREADSLFQELTRSTSSPVLLEEIVQMLPKERTDLFDKMKACLDVAVHMSPLALLGNVPGTSFAISRPILIEVSTGSAYCNGLKSAHATAVGQIPRLKAGLHRDR